VTDNKASGRNTILQIIPGGTPNVAYTKAPESPAARPWSDPEIKRRIAAYFSAPGARKSQRGVLEAVWQPNQERVSRRKVITLAKHHLTERNEGGRPKKT
jgi:hypothetical protein